MPSCSRKFLILALSLALIVSSVPGTCVIYAYDPLGSDPGNTQPEKSYQSETDPNANNSEIPSGSLMSLMGSPLSAPSVTVLPQKPCVQVNGYNLEGRKQYPGYVTLNPIDNSNFSYRYDVGAARGATVDTVISKTGAVMDLSAGFSMQLKRVNKVATSEGIHEMTVLFWDNAGHTIEQRIQLMSDYQAYSFSLAAAGFDNKQVTKIAFRLTYTDIEQATYQEDRRGEIFVNVGGLDIAPAITGSGFDSAALTKFPSNTEAKARGFIRGPYSVPGYVKLTNEGDGIRGIRYDVGGSAGAVVQTDIVPKGGVLSLGKQLVLGMKNSGNGAKALVQLTDSNGNTKEFTLKLTGAYQNFTLNLENPAGVPNAFDYNAVTSVVIEVTRKLSPDRKGQINFYLPLEGTQQDPITQITPTVNPVSVPFHGNASVSFSAVSGAAIYQVQVAKDAAFTNIVHEGFPTNTSEPFQIRKSGTYYVRVRGSKTTDVNVGPVSQWGTRTITADVVYDKKNTVDPVTTSQAGVSEIKYSAISGVAIYQVQVSTDVNFTNIVYEGFPSGTTESTDLKTNGTYYVRVRGSVSTDLNLAQVSEWSTPVSFSRNVDSRTFAPDPNLNERSIVDTSPMFITSVGPGTGGASDKATATDRGVMVEYSTGTPGWSGGGFSFDNFTTTPVEYGAFDNPDGTPFISRLTFGIKGDASSVKLEIVDDQDKKSSVQLTGIRSDVEQFWSVPTSLFQGIDRTHVRLFYFIVEGANQSGKLYINRLPVPAVVNPSATLTTANIVDFSNGDLAAHKIHEEWMWTSVLGSSADFVAIPRGHRLVYETGNFGGWVRAGFDFDNASTPEKESGNLSALTQLTFGVKGFESNVKLVIEDDAGQTSTVLLSGVRIDLEQVYAIPMSLFSPVDLTHVRRLYFLIDGNNKSGTMFFYHLPTQ